MRPALVFINSLFVLAAGSARAVEVSTSTHVGYGLVARSTDGFSDVGGSLAFCDISVPLLTGSQGLDGGLRSLAQGGRTTGAQFYRLGSGPFLSWEAFQNLYLQLTVNAYRETDMDAEGHIDRRLFGRTLMAGTQRFFYRSARVDAGWGGFVARHVADGSASVMRGVDLSLRLRL